MPSPYARIAMEENPRYEGAVATPVTGPNRVSTVNFYWPLKSARIDPGISLFERNDEIRGTLSDPPTLIDAFDPTGNLNLNGYLNAIVPLLHLSGLVMTPVSGTGTQAVQTITTTGTPTGGTFTLTFGGVTTGPIPYNATAAQVEAALDPITPVGVTCTGGPLPTGVVVTFNDAGAKALITHTDSLTGGSSPTVVVTSTTPGTTGAVTDPDGNAVPTGVTVWTSSKRSGVTAKSAQVDICRPDEGFFERLQGAGVSQLAINANGDTTADLMGLVHQSITDPSLTPTYDSQSILPVRRGDVLLSWLSGSAYTQDFNVTIANNIERGDHLGIRSYFRKRLDATGQPVRLTGQITQRDITSVEFAAMMAQSTFVAKAGWRAAKGVGTTNYPYSMWIQMPSCQIRGWTPDPLTNARRFGAQFDWVASYDEAAGYDFKVTVANSLTAVETYV